MSWHRLIIIGEKRLGGTWVLGESTVGSSSSCSVSSQTRLWHYSRTYITRALLRALHFTMISRCEESRKKVAAGCRIRLVFNAHAKMNRVMMHVVCTVFVPLGLARRTHLRRFTNISITQYIMGNSVYVAMPTSHVATSVDACKKYGKRRSDISQSKLHHRCSSRVPHPTQRIRLTSSIVTSLKESWLRTTDDCT